MTQVYTPDNPSFGSYESTISNIRTRHNGLFNLVNTGVTIYGAGAIGSYTASTLARCCIGRLALYDGDEVGAENIGVQDYTIPQIGKPKVFALEQNILSINPAVYTNPVNEKVGVDTGSSLPYHARQPEINVHVLAVDNMEARASISKLIFDFACTLTRGSYANETFLFIDARMGSNTLQLHMMQCKYGLRENNISRGYYNKYMDTWYSDNEGDSEPCAARSTAYCSSFAGSIITSEIIKWVKGWEFKTEELVFNFPNLMLEAKVTNDDRSRAYTLSSKTYAQQKEEAE
jgi:hypothetical protein